MGVHAPRSTRCHISFHSTIHSCHVSTSGQTQAPRQSPSRPSRTTTWCARYDRISAPYSEHRRFHAQLVGHAFRAPRAALHTLSPYHAPTIFYIQKRNPSNTGQSNDIHHPGNHRIWNSPAQYPENVAGDTPETRDLPYTLPQIPLPPSTGISLVRRRLGIHHLGTLVASNWLDRLHHSEKRDCRAWCWRCGDFVYWSRPKGPDQYFADCPPCDIRNEPIRILTNTVEEC